MPAKVKTETSQPELPVTSMNVPTPSRNISAKELQDIFKFGAEMELPSGILARVKPITTRELMLKIGRVPDELTSLVNSLVNPSNSEDQSEMLESFKALDPEIINLQFEFLDKYCALALVSPRIVENPTADDEISADMLSEEDKGFLLAWINAPAIRLRDFRAFQTEFNPSVEPEPGLSSPTE